ncbi:MAG: hypothetical protein JST12_18400 [Armatimonadetes bacterium]|nr:hypothetical protein [Armatimonadota bacterium]MBS1728350.1 hypothetical protein [Armatimonadota bacterium]
MVGLIALAYFCVYMIGGGKKQQEDSTRKMAEKYAEPMQKELDEINGTNLVPPQPSAQAAAPQNYTAPTYTPPAYQQPTYTPPVYRPAQPPRQNYNRPRSYLAPTYTPQINIPNVNPLASPSVSAL